jgi:DNA-binding transcriptional MerR regulator
MPLKVPSEVRASVIRDWLSGKPRDTIARDNVVSAGAVSNIVREWRDALAVSDADALRELGIMFRKLGITAQECAIGFRLAKILKDLGTDEENFGDFVSQVYNECTRIGLKPEYIASNINQILVLSGSIPLSEIPYYIQEKTDERRKLEEDIKKLRIDEEDARLKLMEALDEKKVSLAELDQFYPLKVELDKLGIPIEDVGRTTAIIQGVQKCGYNVKAITELLSTWDASSAIQARLEKNIEELANKRDNLEEEVEKLTDTHRQKESLFRHLQGMGFGIKELKLLFYTIKEVAAENKIPEDQAVQRFLDDIEKNYDTKLGYDSTLERLKSDIQKTNAELNTNRRELSLNKELAGVVTGLLATGSSDQQMLSLVWFLQSVYSNSESLLADIHKYGCPKKAIEVLSQKLGNLVNQTKPSEVERDSTNIPRNGTS